MKTCPYFVTEIDLGLGGGEHLHGREVGGTGGNHQRAVARVSVRSALAPRFTLAWTSGSFSYGAPRIMAVM
jgi:hypothetical protein